MFSVGIADCRVDTFTVRGPGGGGKDTSNTGVRVTHLASGASGEARETRSQAKNKELAFRRMGESKEFKLWVRLKAAELMTGKSIDQRVDEQMARENLKVEVRVDGKWREVSE
jgi:protein subunit release factor A